MKNKIVCNVSPIKDRTPTFEELAFDEQRKIDLEFTLADLAADLGKPTWDRVTA